MTFLFFKSFYVFWLQLRTIEKTHLLPEKMDDIYRAVNQLLQKLIFFVLTWCLSTNIIVFAYDFFHYVFWILYEHKTLWHCHQPKLFLKGTLNLQAIKLVAISIYTLRKSSVCVTISLKKTTWKLLKLSFLLLLPPISC